MRLIYDASRTGWTAFIDFQGIYISEVSKCSKNVNTSIQNPGKYDIVAMFRITCNTGKDNDYRASIFIPLLNNLNTVALSVYGGGFPSSIDAYGVSFDTVLDQDQFDEWLHNSFVQFHTYSVYSDATKINYTDGSYDIIRSVLSENEAKDYAYNQLLQTYGSFYKATESEISKYYKKEITS